MSRTILVIDDSSLEKLYSINLKMYVDTDVIEQTCGAAAVALLNHLPNVNLIIAQEKVGEEDTWKVILKHIQQKDLKIQMIVIGKDELIDKFATRLPPNASLQDVIRAAAKCLGVTAKDMSKQVVPDYIRLPLQYFPAESVCICDVFHQEHIDGAEEQSFTKYFSTDQTIDKDTISNLRKDGVKYLFIPAKNRLKFVNDFSKQVLSTLQDKNASEDSKLNATDCAMHMVSERIKDAGLDEQSVELAKASMKNISELAEDRKNKGLAYCLKKLLENSTSFRYAHCQLISYVASHVIKQMDWGSREQQEKIIFITFFHDILLDTDELCMIHSEEDLLNSSISNDDRELVISHATKVAQIIKTYPHAPIGSDTILEQHHGSRNGNGFPRTLPLNLSPLAIVFIIVESYVHYVLKLTESGEFEHASVIKYLEETFPKGGKVRSTIQHLSKLKF
ncbi:MAG: hypothetical protein ISR65_04105 [Bacteriovoracaceae bacterium]|nr:hypothetical protein [Bacteriovoracaceae bacterium]